jgi:hypothetical protein
LDSQTSPPVNDLCVSPLPSSKRKQPLPSSKRKQQFPSSNDFEDIQFIDASQSPCTPSSSTFDYFSDNNLNNSSKKRRSLTKYDEGVDFRREMKGE